MEADLKKLRLPLPSSSKACKLNDYRREIGVWIRVGSGVTLNLILVSLSVLGGLRICFNEKTRSLNGS